MAISSVFSGKLLLTRRKLHVRLSFKEADMSGEVAAHSRNSSLGGGPSMIGMIRARKLAVKIKKRAQFLVADRTRRENAGRTAVIHWDFPRNFRRDEPTTRLNVPSGRSPPSSRSPSVLSRYGYTHPSQTPKNSYRLEPVSRFSEPKVKEVIEDVLDQNLHGQTYEAVFCKEMTKKLSDTIKQRVKILGFSRYKFICIVYMGQVHNQGMRIGSRCLWDQKFDNVAEGYFRNGDLFAVATVFGVYCE